MVDPKSGSAARILGGSGVTKESLYQALQAIRGSVRITDQNPEDKYEALARYGRDLTDLARKGKLDPVIGRDDEVEKAHPEVFNILLQILNGFA